MPLINSSYFTIERNWLSQFLASFAPGAAIQYEKRLTVQDVAAQQRMGQGVSPRAASRIVAKLDAWVDTPNEIQLWEAKRAAPVQGVIQLIGYQIELPHTWEGVNEALKPVSYHVLAEHPSDRATRLAAEYGIQIHIYLPDWLRGTELAAQQKGETRRLQYLASIGRVPPP